MQFSVFCRCHARFRVNYIPSSSSQSGARRRSGGQPGAIRDSDAQKVTGVKVRGRLRSQKNVWEHVIKEVHDCCDSNVQGSAKRWSLGCVNLPPVVRRSQEPGFTQPRDLLIADPCISSHHRDRKVFH